jgi:hypothetical protein
VDICGAPTFLELQGVGPSWCHSPRLEYHGRYADCFAFAFSVSSRKTLETSCAMREAAVRALVARGRGPCPLVLVGNLDPSLAADVTEEEEEDDVLVVGETGLQSSPPSSSSLPDGKSSRPRTREVTSTEAMAVAEAWGAAYFEVDTSKSGADSVEEMILHLGQKIQESKGVPSAGILVPSLQPARHRGTWLRRVVGHLLPATPRKQ